MAVLLAFYIDMKVGYGELTVQLIWQEKPYLITPNEIASAELKIRGQRQILQLGKEIRLRPGTVPIQLRLKHFNLCSFETHIAKDQRLVAELPLEAEPRTITIVNSLSNVVINGAPCGSEWIIANSKVGHDYHITATAPGYYTNTLTLTISNPGEDLITNLTWRHLMGLVSVHLDQSVNDVSITIDGEPLDSFEGGLMRVGTHMLNASNGDYYPLVQRVDVRFAITNLVDIHMKPKPASLLVTVTPDVSCQLHDEAGKPIIMEGGIAQLQPGTMSLSISAKGYVTQRHDFVIEPNKKYSWSVEFEQAGLQDFRNWQAECKSLESRDKLVLLEKFGGTDWQRITNVDIVTNDLERGAQQYKEICERLGEILNTMPERGRVWTNEIRARYDIDYWIIDQQFNKANNEMAQYRSLYGPGTEFDRWFGGATNQIRTWQESIQLKQRYIPSKP